MAPLLHASTLSSGRGSHCVSPFFPTLDCSSKGMLPRSSRSFFIADLRSAGLGNSGMALLGPLI